MLPSNKQNSGPCNPISSNCVVWQGPDIECINICNGDTVSDVVAALATELCKLIDATCECNPDLTGLDLKCALPTTGEPATFVETMQAIIDYICNLTKGSEVPNINIPPCLKVEDSLGQAVTSLSLQDFATLIAERICAIQLSITSITQWLTNLQNQMDEVVACVLPCKRAEDVDFNIISKGILPGQEVKISTLTLAIENDFVKLRAAVGTPTNINRAISAQDVSSSDKRLSVEGTIGDIVGWIGDPSNLAESNNNQWLLLGDMYTAIADVQAKLPKACDDVTFAFTHNIIDANGDGVPNQINLNFQLTKLPSGFRDCGGSTLVTVTDSDGSSITQNVVVSNLVNSSAGVNINIDDLNVLSSLVLSIAFCATDGVSECADRQQVIIPLSAPCPSTLTVVGALNSINVSFANSLGRGVEYLIEATNIRTGILLSSTSIVNPGTSVTHTFLDAAQGETYDVQVTVIAGPNSRNTCPAQQVLIPGQVCTDTSTNTVTTNAVVPTDIFLGLHDNGPAITRFWYDSGSNIIKNENVGAAVPCDSPLITSPTMDYLGVAGDVAVTVSFGTEPSPVSAEIAYSTDGITYLLNTTGGDGVRTISTGATSGSVYIRVQTTCTGALTSVATILRYDFATEVWTTMQNPQGCATTSLNEACPSGIEVARQYLECGPATYTVFGGSADTYWFFIKKINSGASTRYVYAGWDNTTNSVRSVVECCTCPTFLLSDPIQVLCGTNGDSTNITLPYVLGSGEPNMTVIANPVLGTVTQGATSNQFTYTSIVPAKPSYYADTFQVQLEPTVPGTGDCSFAVMTVQVQMVNCNTKLTYTDQDVYVFINTNGYTSAEGGIIQVGFAMLKNHWNTEFGYTGDIYFIPTSSKRWLGYFKSIVDDGASWVQNPDVAWQGLEVLPASWPGGAGTGVHKNTAMVIILSNDSSIDYHDVTLAAGYGSATTAQPTVSYKEDYDAFVDMLTGTQTSTWAANLGITSNQFPDGLSSVLYPMVVHNSGGVDAANILQMISAYTAELIPPAKYGIATAVDVTNYILQGVASTMPYTGATTPANTITQLFDNNGSGMLALLNQEKSLQVLNEIKDGTNAQFTNLLTRSIKGCNDVYPSSTIPTTNVYQLQDCDSGFSYDVTITGQSCGTIGLGTVIKLTSTTATVPAGGGRPEWTTATSKCLTVVANCTSNASELTATLNSTHPVCSDCTP